MKLVFLMFALLFSVVAFAADPGSVQDFAAQVLQAIHDLGGLPWVGKIALIVSLVIGSMKVSVLAPLWDKLGAAKAWLAPILGLVGGVLSLAVSGTITLSGVLAYASAGAGAVILVELLELVKAIPGLGTLWLSLIDVLEGVLKKPTA